MITNKNLSQITRAKNRARFHLKFRAVRWKISAAIATTGFAAAVIAGLGDDRVMTAAQSATQTSVMTIGLAFAIVFGAAAILKHDEWLDYCKRARRNLRMVLS